jgi:hypothetical protein
MAWLVVIGLVVLVVLEVAHFRRAYASATAIDRRVRFEARLAADVR